VTAAPRNQKCAALGWRRLLSPRKDRGPPRWSRVVTAATVAANFLHADGPSPSDLLEPLLEVLTVHHGEHLNPRPDLAKERLADRWDL
jgi:hypothetical protein